MISEMRFVKSLAAVFLLTLVTSCLSAESARLPDTQAGKVFSEWLSVSNSGDRNAMAAFIAKTSWKRDLDAEMAAREDSGGQDVVEILDSAPQTLVAKTRNRKDSTELMVKLIVSTDEHPHVLIFGQYEIPSGSTYGSYPITADIRQHVIEETRKALTETYVDATIGQRMAVAIERNNKSGRYNQAQEGELLAEAITNDLHAISRDPHLNLYFYLFPQPQPNTNVAASEDSVRKTLGKHNCGFTKAEHVEPNIGYLKIDAFDRPDLCGETASAAMNFLADSDALIIDLRANGGGLPGMVTFVETYLFDHATHLNDIYVRKDDTTHQFWSLPYVPGKRLAKIPVYVLTSKDTFSAAEEFAYTLKSLKRATIVGETTAGGAHPYDTVRVDDHFSFEVPFARSINPVTHGDWEGTGVAPDEKVSASEALARALADAKSRNASH
jgi:hypothetical protein